MTTWSETIAGVSHWLANLVIHKAVIKGDEEVTVAATVTAVFARKARVSALSTSVVFDCAIGYAVVDEEGMTCFTSLFV